MSLLDLVQQQLGDAGGIPQLSQQIGADASTTQHAVDAALPMLLGGMAGAARQPGGMGTLGGLLNQVGGHGGAAGGLGGLLGGLGGMLGGAGGGGIGGILGSVLGQHESTVQDGVQQASGLNGDQTRKLLMILAPIVIAAIAHQRNQAQSNQARDQQAPTAGPGAAAGNMADLDGNGIPDALEQGARQAQAQAAERSPHVGGIVGKLLDMAQRPPR